MTLTLEQHATRRRGIGASEIAALVGLNPWGSPISVYQSKVERIDFAGNAATDHGIRFEPTVREVYAHKMQLKVDQPQTMRHPKNPLVLATPDGIARGPQGDFYLEIKCPTFQTQWDWGKDGTDQIPDYYIPQVTWGMAVTGLKVAHVAALVFNEVRIYAIPYDHELFLALESTAMKFWNNHVVPQVPPPPDASPAFSQWLKQRYRKDNGSEMVGTAATNRLLRELKIAETRRDLAEERLDLLRNRVKDAMGEHTVLIGPSGKVTWKTSSESRRILWEQLAHALAPQGIIPAETLAKHTTVKPGNRQFRTNFTYEVDKTKGAKGV